MAYCINDDNRLDLSGCYLNHGYDFFKIEEIAREYYFTELQNLIAWDGKPIKGMNDERKFRHLVCKHKQDIGILNVLIDLDIKRIESLPVLKLAIEGRLPIDVYKQTSKSRDDRIEIVIEGINKDYVVVLGNRKDHYVIRSAYPSKKQYIDGKIKRSGTFVESIRPNT